MEFKTKPNNEGYEQIMIAIITGASSGIGYEFARQIDKKNYEEILGRRCCLSHPRFLAMIQNLAFLTRDAMRQAVQRLVTTAPIKWIASPGG